MKLRFTHITVCLAGVLAALWGTPGFCQAQKPQLVTQIGHTNGVLPVAFSPDGRVLASGSRDSAVKLWDVASGLLLRTLQGHALSVTALAFSPDGSRLASGGADADARKFLDDLQPTRLFAVPHLVLGGDASLSVFPTAHVERMDIIGPDLPSWKFLGGATNVRELGEAEFHAEYNPAEYTRNRFENARQPGSPQVGFTEYWTVSGQRLFWEVRMESQPLTPMDFKPYIQGLFGAGGLHTHTAEGGVAVLNPANLTRMTFHPGPPDLPAGTWPARRL